MKTVVIRLLESGLTDEAGNKDYEVALFADEGDPDWSVKSIARAPLPSALLPEVTPVGGGPAYSRSQMREIFASVTGKSERFGEIGRYLYSVLFSGDVETKWNSLRAAYPGEYDPRGGLRTILDIDPPELQSLPWELLTHLNTRLFLNPGNPFVRGQVDFTRPVTTHIWPLRVLIVVAVQPDEKIDAEQEVRGIMYSLRRISRTIEVSVVRQQTLDVVTEQYKSFEPHIFHFIGHGGSATVAPGVKVPCLFLRDSKGERHEWRADEIGNGLQGSWAASLAFINACRSGVITLHESSEITRGFAEARIPAVLGMTGDIKEAAAQAFSDGLYRALAEGLPLDSALAAARQSLLPGFGIGDKQWALASLSLSVPPDKVVHIECPIKDDLRLQIKGDSEFRKLDTFIDRVNERASLIKNIDPYKPRDAAQSLLLVRGQSEVGKSWFVHLCMECCAMRGRQFTVVDMRDLKTQTFVDVLRLIRDGNPNTSSLISQPLANRAAFNRFNWELGHLLDGEEPPELPREYVIEPDKKTAVYEEDAASRMKNAPDTNNFKLEYILPIFSNFCDALRLAAGEQPLIIVLDHLKIEPTHFDKYIVPLLIDKIKNHHVRPVRMILVLSPRDEITYNLKGLGAVENVPLSPQEQRDYEPLAYEFLRYHDIPLNEELKKLVKYFSARETIKDGWTPNDLDFYVRYWKPKGTTA